MPNLKNNLFKNKSQTPFQRNFHNSVWPLTSQYFNKIPNPFLGKFTKISSTTNFSNFLDPSLGEDLYKTWYGFYQNPKYRSHSRETSQNTSNFHNFSKLRTCPTALTTDPKVYEHSPDNIIDAPKSSQISD